MKIINLFLAIIVSSPLLAQQNLIEIYEDARDNYFWPKFYEIGGTTIYCGLEFSPPDPRKIDDRSVSAEHVFAAKWMLEKFNCSDRDKCKDKGFQRAEADLHNLWPAIININSSRQELPFGEITGESQSKDEKNRAKDNLKKFHTYCPDYARTYKDSGEVDIVEPRDSVKGNIARSLLYMMDSYNLKLPDEMELVMLLKWHLADPPDEIERLRNLVFEQLQGTKNPYIY